MVKTMSQEEMKEFLQSQIDEIMKYKWCLGVNLHHDPLLDKSIEDIGNEWINLYAKVYREDWEKKHNKGE